MHAHRRSHRHRWRMPTQSPAQRIAQGEGGERALQDWLDRSRLPYLFLDQTPLTMPTAHRADIKRPDFLVAIEGLGTIAVDAKAKAFVDGCFILDVSERRRLDGFETLFGLPVWYACLPPAEPQLSYLFRNRDLFHRSVMHDADRQLIRIPITLGLAANPLGASFAHTLLCAIDRRAPAVRQEEPGDHLGEMGRGFAASPAATG